MQAFYDFFPIIAFGIFYYFFGIYVATAAAMVASAIQLIITWLKHKKLDKIQTVTFVLIFVLGGATIIFHNPLFIKWKPSVIYWLFGVLLIGNQWMSKKPFLKNMLESKIKLPESVWAKLTWMWAVFFLAMGCANTFVAYLYSTKIWVYFKVFGTLGFTLAFVVIQAFYLAKYIEEPQADR